MAPRLERLWLEEIFLVRLVLVRPDGHVGWRGDSGPRDARGIIEQVRGGNGHV